MPTRPAGFIGTYGRLAQLSARSEEHAGRVGTVSHYDVARGRFAFELAGGELIHVRARISLANSTRPGAQDALVTGCEPPPRGLSVLGFAVGSINEEYVRISDSVGCHCPFEACDVGRISFDRPLRLPHEPGEEISVMPDSLQVPSGRLTAEPPRDEHHTRAMVAAMRAHDWVTGLARVVSEGPDKWALRQLLCVLALILMGACVIGTLLLCCSTIGKAKAGGKGELATG